MMQRFEYAFTAEAVERPEQHQIELVLAGVLEQALELLAVAVLAGGAVHILAADGPLLRGGGNAQLRELIFGVLPFVAGRDAGVESDLHSSILSVKHLFLEHKMGYAKSHLFAAPRAAKTNRVFETAAPGARFRLHLQRVPRQVETLHPT